MTRPAQERVARSQRPRCDLKSPGGGNPIAPRIEPLVANADGAYVKVDTSTTPSVQAKGGLSFVGVDNARRNLSEENPGRSFSVIHNDSHRLWNSQLHKIQIAARDMKSHSMFTPRSTMRRCIGTLSAMSATNTWDSTTRCTAYQGNIWNTGISPDGHLPRPGAADVNTGAESGQDEVRSMLDQYRQTCLLPK